MLGRAPAPRHDHVRGGLKDGGSPAHTNKGWERRGLGDRRPRLGHGRHELAGHAARCCSPAAGR
eukprot:14209693-Alexandrium_andersonii.AAC.1